MESSQNTVGRRLWRLTALGKQQMKTCFKLSSLTHVLGTEVEDPAQMSKYELLLALQKDGWAMKVIMNQQEAKDARNKPFIAGSGAALVWYVKRHDS